MATPTGADPATAAATNHPRGLAPSSNAPYGAVPHRSPFFTPLVGRPLNPTPPTPPPHGPIFVAGSSTRGFPARPYAAVRSQISDQTVTVASRPYLYSAHSMPQMHAPLPTMRMQQPQFLPPVQIGVNVSATAQQPKVSSFQAVASALESNSSKDRDRSKEDNVLTVYNRKVRLLDGDSNPLYTLCRSWVHNASAQESQLNFRDGTKLLPKPLPASVVNSDLSKKNEGDSEAEEDLKREEPVGPSDQLSTRELLNRLVKRSKRVRARLHKERSGRIARYKHRLSLLIPPSDELGYSDAGPRS